jgi:glycosyltransferase involved in cell wall biosynthesis
MTNRRYGGTRALFQVSNGLVDRGHDVVFTSFGNPDDHKWFPLKAEVRYVRLPLPLGSIRQFIINRFYKLWDYDYESALARTIPDCDINVATLWSSVYPTFQSHKGKMFHYVQHYEPLFVKDRFELTRAKLTYFFPMKKLVVSKWLQTLIKQMTGQDPFYVGNGVDKTVFYARKVKSQTSQRTVVALIRGVSWKGDQILINALNTVAKKMPDIKLIAVGSKKAFRDLIGNKHLRFKYDLVESPEDSHLAEIYSSGDVFAYASYSEGFGLPPLESMACGTPVVTTSCVGVKEYAINEYNALLAPVGDSQGLSQAIQRLLVDESLSEKLRKNGLETAKQYTWDRVIDNVESAFKTELRR